MPESGPTPDPNREFPVCSYSNHSGSGGAEGSTGGQKWQQWQEGGGGGGGWSMRIVFFFFFFLDQNLSFFMAFANFMATTRVKNSPCFGVGN